jgi:hypothetical protein
MTEKNTVSPTCRRRLEEQGFRGLSDSQLAEHKFGIRFAYYLCGTLVLIGLLFQSIPLLSVMLVIAALGMVPPRHPLDYLFNGVVRHLVGRPKLAARANQGRFACAMATVLLAGIIYSFYIEAYAAGYVLGAVLMISATLVSTLDICIPSKIYNVLFERSGAGTTHETGAV